MCVVANNSHLSVVEPEQSMSLTTRHLADTTVQKAAHHRRTQLKSNVSSITSKFIYELNNRDTVPQNGIIIKVCNNISTHLIFFELFLSKIVAQLSINIVAKSKYLPAIQKYKRLSTAGVNVLSWHKIQVSRTNKHR